MSFRRHASVTLTNAATQVVSAIPNVDELVILLMGTQNNGVGDNHRLRPNSDAGANYATVRHFGSSSPSSGADAGPTNGLQVGVGIAGSVCQGVHRLIRQGNVWHMLGQMSEYRSGTNYRYHAGLSGHWNSAGVALTTLQFLWNVDGATVTFTGRLEVWYRDA